MVESFYNESALFHPNVFMICILSDVLQPSGNFSNYLILIWPQVRPPTLHAIRVPEN